jgi:excisionase family DNA binding protein
MLTVPCNGLYDFVPMQQKRKSRGVPVLNSDDLLKLRDAALQLGISFPTIKQWIYKKKIRSIQTVGGHHRIPQPKSTSCSSESAAVPNKIDKDRSSAASAGAINSWVASIRSASAA